jgi:glycosyltransferase involved in cell wall biosynthesis
MKILYLAGRWDPTIQNEYSGSDYGAYHMLKRQPGVEIALVGPLEDRPNLVEKAIFKVNRMAFKKQLIKYYPSSLRKIGKAVNQAIVDFQPDVIFSKYSAPVVHANIDRPFVYMCDSTVKWTKEIWPTFSKLGFQVMEKWEEKAIRESDQIITFSKASADIIISAYHKEPAKVQVFPIPAYIPAHLLPEKNAIQKEIQQPLKLLLVGKRYHLRGMDIAIEAIHLLNQNKYPAELRIVGMTGKDQDFVKFIGVYDKEDPAELKSYFESFKWADLLVHPSRFHSAGIVISEAAAFGLPTITNAAGGLATTVEHNLTGLVLPEKSPPSAYVESIISLIKDKDRYQKLRRSARQRFDAVLNWETAGQHLFEIIKQVHQARF